MATKFTNKYMQVFQNYNEFGEHSADYVRGEDHIAFLIEENEVIYWLYLEQVWRPLNVRTTTTGELEDGRTKVAVRLEYIEGGQKYTSVPNIPDPERITSMSHFLEDYPDIEEVNVTGTINLTDLSYAFAGSNIRDFSKLDTRNVNNIAHFIDNINNSTLDVDLNFNPSNGDFNNVYFENIIMRNLKYAVNNPSYRPNDEDEDYSFIYQGQITNCSINELNVIDGEGVSSYISLYDNNINKLFGNNKEFEITENNAINNVVANHVTILTKGIRTFTTINVDGDKLSIANTANNNGGKDIDFKIISENNNIELGDTVLYYYFNSIFGYGIKYKNDASIEIIGDISRIGNFIFTTPIVDDAFYAKYAQYNTPISIFQYKTTFEEVADVKITEATDSSLIYVDWNQDLTNSLYNDYNIEIYNKINAITLDYYYFSDGISKIKKFIIDNRNIDLGDDKDTYPNLSLTYSSTKAKVDYTNYRISGKYRVNGNSNNDNSFMIKDIELYPYNYNYYFGITTYITEDYDFKLDKNIKIDAPIFITFYDNDLINTNNNFEVDSLIKNNILEIGCSTGNSRSVYVKLKYVENVKLIILGGYLYIFDNWLTHTNENNIIDIKYDCSLNNNNGAIRNVTTNENMYLNCYNDSYISQFDGYSYNLNKEFNVLGINIYGKININLSSYKNNFDYTDNNIKHIDINSIKCSNGYNYSYTIMRYLSLDNESTINLITKLVDNTSSSTKTIYMYRSQANIIGEENIAAAVAKNYEFAIIED